MRKRCLLASFAFFSLGVARLCHAGAIASEARSLTPECAGAFLRSQLRNILEDGPRLSWKDFSKPLPIEANPKIKTAAREVERAGLLLEDDQGLSHLTDGRYIFLIASDGTGQVHVMYSPRTTLALLNSSTWDKDGILVTHRSLRNEFIRRFGPDIVVYGGGEWDIHYGRVARFRNKTGTYPNDAANLIYAVRVMHARGLPFESGTHLQDFRLVPFDRAHASESKAVEAELEWSSNPDFQALTSEIYSLYRRLYGIEEFRDANLPGHVAVERLMVEYIADRPIGYDSDDTIAANACLKDIVVDGVYWAARGMYYSGTPVESVRRVVDNIIRTQGARGH